MSLGKKTWEWVLADTKNDTSFHTFKNQHYSKMGENFLTSIFNYNKF